MLITAVFWIVLQVVFGIAVFVIALVVGDVKFPTDLTRTRVERGRAEASSRSTPRIRSR